MDDRAEEQPNRRDRAWGLVRHILGIAQMVGALTGMILLVQTGVSTLTLAVVIATGMLTGISLALFRGSK